MVILKSISVTSEPKRGHKISIPRGKEKLSPEFPVPRDILNPGKMTALSLSPSEVYRCDYDCERSELRRHRRSLLTASEASHVYQLERTGPLPHARRASIDRRRRSRVLHKNQKTYSEFILQMGALPEFCRRKSPNLLWHFLLFVKRIIMIQENVNQLKEKKKEGSFLFSLSHKLFQS